MAVVVVFFTLLALAAASSRDEPCEECEIENTLEITKKMAEYHDKLNWLINKGVKKICFKPQPVECSNVLYQTVLEGVKRGSTSSIVHIDNDFTGNSPSNNLSLLSVALSNNCENDETCEASMGSVLNSCIPPPECRSSPLWTSNSGCRPELSTVVLKRSPFPSILFKPDSVRVGRCSGSCYTSLLSCEPAEVEIIAIPVLKFKVIDSEILHLVDNETVTVENHKTCNCGCVIKEENCTENQAYNKRLCLCNCINEDVDCKNNKKENHIWRKDECICDCVHPSRDHRLCSMGMEFSLDTCKCEKKDHNNNFTTNIKK